MMSEMEKIELETRVKAVTTEEAEVIAKALPDNILWNELRARYAVIQNRLRMIEGFVNR